MLREHVCVEDFVLTNLYVFIPFLSSSLSTWQCKYCTTVNTLQLVLCETCDRPRLSSSAPSLQEEPSQPSTISGWPAFFVFFVTFSNLNGPSVLLDILKYQGSFKLTNKHVNMNIIVLILVFCALLLSIRVAV